MMYGSSIWPTGAFVHQYFEPKKQHQFAHIGNHGDGVIVFHGAIRIDNDNVVSRVSAEHKAVGRGRIPGESNQGTA